MRSKQPKKYRKLTFADAQAIRAAREQNPALSLADLAAKFGFLDKAPDMDQLVIK